jgi:hypothetical protein
VLALRSARPLPTLTSRNCSSFCMRRERSFISLNGRRKVLSHLSSGYIYYEYAYPNSSLIRVRTRAESIDV